MDEKSTTPDETGIADDIMDYMDVDDDPPCADGPQSPTDHPVLGAGENKEGKNMEQEREHETGESGPGRRTVAVVAAVCAAVLAVGGIVGYKAWTDHETTLASQECQDASVAADKARTSYAQLVDGDAADMAKTTSGQVRDSKTVDALAKALQESEPKTASCKADDSKSGYAAASETLAKNKTWYESHTKSLKSAVGRVSDSKLAKTIADAESLYSSSDGRVQDTSTRDALRKAIDAKDETAIGKATAQVNDSIAAKTQADAEEAARKQAEEEAAQAQAQAEAAAAAQTQQSYSYSQDYQYYSQDNSYSGGSTQSDSSGTGTSSSSDSSGTSGPISGGHGCTTDCPAASSDGMIHR